MLPQNLLNRLKERKEKNNLRELGNFQFKVDFFSNDYLGYAQNEALQEYWNKYRELNK
jgi:8-amino-7-oxononanoate synthase